LETWWPETDPGSGCQPSAERLWDSVEPFGDIVARMLDHVSLRVRDFDRVLSFYRAALAPLGYLTVMEFPGTAGLGEPGKPDLWLTQTDQELNPTHLAFAADRAQVDAFHAAALTAGGTDNGGPGVRTDYHPHYYAAFVVDPEGNNVEVVCQANPNAKVATSAKARPKKTSAKVSPKKASPKKASPKKASPNKASAKKTAARPKAKAKPMAKATKAKAAKPKAKAKRR
jgi:catechol 2,3-dioxygenase-like lactoylglutathione lyase family enzyme